MFKDSKTPNPFIEHFPNDDGSAAENALPDHIYMDCMGLGAGCCCLQITFRASDIDEARYLYDQLAVVSPIMVRTCVCVCVCVCVCACFCASVLSPCACVHEHVRLHRRDCATVRITKNFLLVFKYF